MIGPCTWDSQKSPAVLCTCPCLHPCTSLSRSLLPRSSWRLHPQICTSVLQSSSQQKIYLWNSVMYELCLFFSLKLKPLCAVAFLMCFGTSLHTKFRIIRAINSAICTKFVHQNTLFPLQIGKVDIKYLHACNSAAQTCPLLCKSYLIASHE